MACSFFLFRILTDHICSSILQELKDATLLHDCNFLIYTRHHKGNNDKSVVYCTLILNTTFHLGQLDMTERGKSSEKQWKWLKISNEQRLKTLKQFKFQFPSPNSHLQFTRHYKIITKDGWGLDYWHCLSAEAFPGPLSQCIYMFSLPLMQWSQWRKHTFKGSKTVSLICTVWVQSKKKCFLLDYKLLENDIFIMIYVYNA